MINEVDVLKHLAEARKYHEKEIGVQTEMKGMFKSLGMGPVLAQTVGKREADIHVTDYNCVVETKRPLAKRIPEPEGLAEKPRKSSFSIMLMD